MLAIAYPSASLAAMITRAASMQTYNTIRALVPPEHRRDAFRAYSYFRWVDDLLDGDVLNSQEQLAFLASRKQLLALKVFWPPSNGKTTTYAAITAIVRVVA